MNVKLDILAFGSHPDDVELGCAGTILSVIADGKKAGIVDLTQGELGTRGSAETRAVEASAAAKMLGVEVRENLQMPDGFFMNDETNQRKIITVIRKYQPEIILCSAPDDRHPDHARSSKLVTDAAFLAGLVKIKTAENSQEQTPWRPSYIFYYIQDKFIQPSFVIDISKYMQKKLEIISCYQSQFHNSHYNSGEPATYISSPQYFDGVKARALMLGKRIGVNYAEGFISEKTPGFNNFDGFIKNAT